jgi:hypothetical protein
VLLLSFADGTGGSAFFETAWFFVALIAMHLRILLHELAHLAVARGFGLELDEIRVGEGPRLWRARGTSGLIWAFHLWPSGGYVRAFDVSLQGFRTRQFLLVLAGPLMDLLVLFGLCVLMRDAFASFPVLPAVLFLFTALSALGGLVPRRVKIGGHDAWSDGFHLLQLLTAASHQLEAAVWRQQWGRALAMQRRSKVSTGALAERLQTHAVGESKEIGAFKNQRAKLQTALLVRAMPL